MMKTIHLVPILSALLLSTAVAQEKADPNAAPPASAPALAAPSSHDGFVLRGIEAVIIRNGVASVVEREVILPNGLRVLPNGNVTLRDGTATTLRTNQLLTFEGKFEDLAPAAQSGAPRTSVGPTHDFKTEVGISSHDGITIAGTDVFITRNGVTEKVTTDVRLPNGVTARPDGTIVLANGTKITLRPDQVLDLNGILRDAPVQPSIPGPNPSTNPAQ